MMPKMLVFFLHHNSESYIIVSTLTCSSIMIISYLFHSPFYLHFLVASVAGVNRRCGIFVLSPGQSPHSSPCLPAFTSCNLPSLPSRDFNYFMYRVHIYLVYVNGIRILKNSTNLLSLLGHLGVRKAASIQTFDFSTLYTSIRHDLLISRMNNIINNTFKHKNRAARYTHIKVGRNKSYFNNDPLNGDNKYTASDTCKMIKFLVDNRYVRLGELLFQQMVSIPMGTNCVPLFADLFLIPMRMRF